MGVVSTTAAVALVSFAAPASASSEFGHCSADGSMHYEFTVNYQVVGTRYRIDSYSYKIYGPIRDENNIRAHLVRRSTDAVVPGSEMKKDEFPESSNTTWTRVDIPDFYVGTNDSYVGAGWAKFDVAGPDPECEAWTTPLRASSSALS